MRIPKAAHREALSELVTGYQERLAGPDGGNCRQYLEQRSIGQWAIDKFQLGFDGERLVIPYLTPTGPWQLKRRCIAAHDCKDTSHPKYIYDDGAAPHLFNAQTLRTAETVALVEGEMDAVSVEACGVAAVGYPGAQTWKSNRHWVWAFDSCKDVIVVADGDEVGISAAKTVAESLRLNLPHVDVRMVAMPAGADANSYITSEGDFAFMEKIGAL